MRYPSASRKPIISSLEHLKIGISTKSMHTFVAWAIQSFGIKEGWYKYTYQIHIYKVQCLPTNMSKVE